MMHRSEGCPRGREALTLKLVGLQPPQEQHGLEWGGTGGTPHSPPEFPFTHLGVQCIGNDGGLSPGAASVATVNASRH